MKSKIALGTAQFGLDYGIYWLIRKDVKKYRKAIRCVNEKFIPIWLEKSYKINGCMYNKIIRRIFQGLPYSHKDLF